MARPGAGPSSFPEHDHAGESEGPGGRAHDWDTRPPDGTCNKGSAAFAGQAARNSVSSALAIPSTQTSSMISPFSRDAARGEDSVPLDGVRSVLTG